MVRSLPGPGTEPLIGLFLSRPGDLIVEMAGLHGFDFVVVDGEHGRFEERDYAPVLASIAGSGMIGMVRVSGHDAEELRRRLRDGADAVVVPHVATEEEARFFAEAVRAGSADPTRRAGFIALLESAAGAENAERILAVEGVDGAFIGPNDLSADLGTPGDYDGDAYRDAVERIERACAATGKLVGTVPLGEHTLARLRDRGHRLLVVGVDAWTVGDAVRELATEARIALGSADPIGSTP